MSQFEVEISWKNNQNEFSFKEYSRDHSIKLGFDQIIKNSAAPEYFGSKEATNPEELLAAALGSCHMLTFFAIASKSGYVIESYYDKASALLGKNDSQKISVTEIKLSPTIVFSGEKRPTTEELKAMHEKAHNNCFIAQSLKTKVTIV